MNLRNCSRVVPLAGLLMASVVLARQDNSELDIYQKVSDLIGKDVKNAQGENLGDIKEVVLDPAHRKVRYTVVSFGGFLGLGDKLFALPWSAFTWQGRDKDILLRVDKERFKNAPGFDKDHWPDMANPTWSAEVDRYYDLDRKDREEREGARSQEPGMRTETTGMGKNWVKFSDLKGKDVLDARGEKVGEIEDAVINVTRGTVPFYVVEAEKLPGLDGELVALPLAVGTVGADHRFSMTIPKDRLVRAPAFKKSQWPSLNHPYVLDVWRFYGIPATGELESREGLGRAGLEPGMGREPSGKECVSMRKLLQSSVRDSTGKNVGKVKDVVADANHGRVEFVLVDLENDPAAGGDGKCRAVPWSICQMVSGENACIVKADAKQVQNAPVFEEARLNQMDREELRRQVYGHFGLSPNR